MLKAFQVPGNGIDADYRTLLASTDSEGPIFLWELLGNGPKLLRTLNGHIQTAMNIFLLPSNQNLLVSSSYDGTVRVWDIKSGAQTMAFQLLDGNEKVHSSPDSQESFDAERKSVSATVATSDGRIIFGGGSGRVRVWNTSTG
jgi:WD40 repeat protein